MSDAFEVVGIESMRAESLGVRLELLVDHPAEERAYRVTCLWSEEDAFTEVDARTWGNDCVERDLTVAEREGAAFAALKRFLECNDDLIDHCRAFAVEADRELRADNDFDAWRAARCS